MPATNNQSPKRVRFDPVAAPTPPFISPSSAAESSAAFAASSLPITLSSHALDMAKTNIKAYRSILEQTKTLKNVENGDSIPRSVRTNFSLTTTKRFESDAAFKKLQEEADETVATYHTAMKNIIVKKIKFEVNKLKEEAARTTVVSAYRLTEMFLIVKGINNNIDKTTKTFVKQLFSSEEVRSIIDYDALPLVEAHSTAETAAFVTPELTTIYTSLQQHLVGVLIRPIKVFHEKDAENLLVARIQLIATGNTLESTTAATAMAVDEEITATPDSIRDEVRKQVNNTCKTLSSKIEALALALKNEKEGPKPSASTKNKTGNKNAKRNQGRADANTNASSNANKTKKKKANKKKPATTPTSTTGNSGN